MDNDELLIVIKDMFEKKTDEIKQYIDTKINGQNVLLESIRSDIKAIADGHGILNAKLDRIETKVDHINKGFYSFARECSP